MTDRPSTVKINPPTEFNWIIEEWPAWRSQFDRYRRLSVKNDPKSKDLVESVDYLLYLLGPRADQALKTFQFVAPKSAENIDDVLEAFDSYFGGKVNVIYERAKFNQRTQKTGESAIDFITDLFDLAERCNYGALKEELIRDRIIVGITDSQLSAALQMEANITLTKVRARVLQAEDVSRQLPTLRNGNGGTSHINFVKKGSKPKFSRPKSNPNASSSQDRQKKNTQKYPESCVKCGRSPSHRFSECPAKNAVCSKCGHKGHWAIKCKTQNVTEVDVQAQEATLYYLECVTHEPRGKSLRVNITSNGTPVCWKIDSGADVPIIGDRTVDLLQPRDVVEPSGTRLLLAGEVRANVTGKCQIQLEWKGKLYDTWAYIMPDQKTPLLARHLALEMGLIKLDPEVFSVSQENLPEQQFPEIFRGLGRMNDEYTMRLSEGARPYAVAQSRGVSVPLLRPTKAVIDELLELDAIETVTGPTPWCAPMVPIPKADGTVRLTVDYTQLNKFVQREYFEMPTVDECLATIGTEAKVFSKLDAKWGYWQVPLAEESRPLTTFITPFGRFQWKRMPMGLVSSGEVYKCRKVKVLEGLKGVINHVDDDLVWGRSEVEHDERLREVLKRYKEAGITLNQEKCQIRVTECEFLGQRVSAQGVKPGAKISDVLDMPIPKDETALRSFLSSARYYLKFIPDLAQMLKPLNDLLTADASTEWTTSHQESFARIKEALASTKTLALFDAQLPTRLTCDASKYGLGAVLEQQQKNGEWRPVHFASRVLSETETRYAQIEKEALASTWGAEKMSGYLIGQPFELVTDHKPLTSILGDKPIGELSSRLQRFRMRLAPYRYKVTYVPGKCMYAADTLSRLPSTKNQGQPDVIMEVHSVESLPEIPMAPTLWKAVKAAQEADQTCRALHTTILEGWPRTKQEVQPTLREFFEHRGMLNVLGSVILFAKRVLIPPAMRKDILEKIHQGHLGTTKCRGRAQDTVWWPSISKQVTDFVEKCEICRQQRKNAPEPLISTPIPGRPWETIGMDFAERGKKKYLVIVDYFSTYIEVVEVASTSTATVVPKLFEVFGRHGIPNVVRSDNGPPFNSHEFSQFASLCNFQHITSSPKAPWSNGKAEAAVRKAKQIISKEPLLHMGLLALRTAPLEEGPSPGQLLMGRRLRTSLPQLEEQLKPEWPDLQDFRRKREERQAKQEVTFNSRHRSKELRGLEQGERVWVSDMKCMANVLGKADTPRSFHLLTDRGSRIRRNRRALVSMPDRAAAPQTLQTYHYLEALQGWKPQTPPSTPPSTPPGSPPRTPPRGSPPPVGTPPRTPPRESTPPARTPPRRNQNRRSWGRGTRVQSPPRPGDAGGLAGNRPRRDIRPPSRYAD